MLCRGCGNPEAQKLRIKYTKKGEKQEVCDKCGNLGSFTVPDAYCPVGGYFDENLADKAHKKGQWVNSRDHKAELLKRLNLREAGSDPNPATGKVTPYFRDPGKRRKYCLDNFG